MNYSFDKQHAINYGVDEAIMIHNFIFWIDKNRANKKHFYDNRYWTYNSVEAFKELFEFWTAKQLRRIIESLVDQKIIMRGNYNKSNIDRTGWYAFINEDAFLGIYDLPKRENEFAQKGEAIPYSKTDNKQYLSNDKDNSDIFSKEELSKITKSKIPTLEETENYFISKLSTKQLAKKFYNFYESKNWMVGKNKMTKWKAAASNWIEDNQPKENKLNQSQTINF